MNVAASENSAIRRAQTASREIGASVNTCRRIQGVLLLDIAGKNMAKGIIFCLGKARLGLKRRGNEETSVVKKAVDLDLDAFTRRTAMAGAGSEKSARLLFCLSFDAPFFDPRDQHSGVKQAGFCLGRGRRCGSGDP